MKYAIVESGGKQYRMEEGANLKVDRIHAEPGTDVFLDKVLLVGNSEGATAGQPYVSDAKVACEVMEHGRDKKIVVFRFWRRKDSRKKQGHRQEFTRIKVKSIQA
ncbi:MAG: 50S ribosomal protein L21 [Desulfovibrionales bacterium]|nr:MAG: 50S ribosomal protein L21 [Desulfovibrionales bacterium]